MMFLFDFPTDDEPEKKEKKENTIKPVHKKKLILLIISIMLVVIVIASIGILVKTRAPKNISPYCMLMRDQGKVCKIHNKKHSSKDVSEMVIPEEEMVFHQQLFDEISNGAYFDGKTLYKKENEEEILAIKNALEQEKESLFEGYLSSTLTKQEKEQYNVIIEELGTLDEVIETLNIQEIELQEPSKEDLIKEVASLKKELSEVKEIQTVQTEPVQTETVQNEVVKNEVVKNEVVKNEVVQTETKVEPKAEGLKQEAQDNMLYLNNASKILNIPKDIEQAATIKKSALYN